MKKNYDEPMFIDVKRGRVEEEEGPASKDKDVIIVEAITGSLDLLVDNIRTPERLVIDKGSGEDLRRTY